MDISRIRALRGPNLWTRQTAIEAIVRCEPDERAIDSQPEFEATLRERFPQLDPWPRLPEGMSLAHALKRVALAFQAHAGCPVSFARCTETVEPGTYQVVVEYTEEAVGRAAFDAAVRLIAAVRAHESQPFDLATVLAPLLSPIHL